MTTINIAIAPQSKIRERVLAIAKGEIKPGPNDPKIWFTSVNSVREVLNDESHPLFRTMRGY